MGGSSKLRRLGLAAISLLTMPLSLVAWRLDHASSALRGDLVDTDVIVSQE